LAEVTKHVLYVHDKVPRPKRPKVPCPDCGKLFSGNLSRNMHLRKFHGRTDIFVKEWALQCNNCPRKFTSRRYLYSHLNREHGENHDMSIFTPRKPGKPRKRKRKKTEISDSDDSSQEEVIEEYPGHYVV